MQYPFINFFTMPEPKNDTVTDAIKCASPKTATTKRFEN